MAPICRILLFCSNNFREVRMKEADFNINLSFLGGGCIRNLRAKKWRMWLKEVLRLVHIHKLDLGREVKRNRDECLFDTEEQK